MAPVPFDPIPMYEVCPQVADLGALGFSFKKVFKKIVKPVQKAVKGPGGIVRILTAPMTIGPTAIARGVTWAGGQAGIKPLGKASNFLRQELDKQAAVVGAEAAIGAVVGGAILAAPAVAGAAGAAASAMGVSAASVGAGLTTAATAIGKDAITSMAAGAAKNLIGGKGGAATPPPPDTPTTEVNATPYGPPPPPPQVLKAGMFDGANLYVAIGGTMAVGLIVYALYGRKPAAAAAPGPLSSLTRARRRRRARRSA